MNEPTRCPWCLSHPLSVIYHDTEWGVVKAADNDQFEHLCLEVFQTGLSWLTILKKREAFRAAFAGFDPHLVAKFDERDAERLLADAGIIRNRRKIEATIHNAGLFIQVSGQYGSFAKFMERYRPAHPLVHKDQSTIPATSPESVALAKELKRLGFRHLGPTTIYAHMQSVGIVDDHIDTCWRYGKSK